jgi:hypothetical protein
LKELPMEKKDKPKELPLLATAKKPAASRSIAIQMKSEGWRALRDLALDRNTSLQKLGIEAFNDLMAKHGRKHKIESAWE